MVMEAGASYRDRQREFREGEILRTCIEMLAEQGCGSLKMDDLARRLGISKATLYDHFRTRESLIRAALETASTPLLDHLRSSKGEPGEQAYGEAVRFLVSRALGDSDDFCGCCFREVSCPFGGWGAIDTLVDERSGSPDHLPTSGVMRALVAAVLWRARSDGSLPGAEEIEAVVARVLARP